ARWSDTTDDARLRTAPPRTAHPLLAAALAISHTTRSVTFVCGESHGDKTLRHCLGGALLRSRGEAACERPGRDRRTGDGAAPRRSRRIAIAGDGRGRYRSAGAVAFDAGAAEARRRDRSTIGMPRQ